MGFMFLKYSLLNFVWTNCSPASGAMTLDPNFENPDKPHRRRYLMVPVGEGSGLMRWAMLSGMLMVSGEICGCTGFTGDSGASRFTFFPLERAVKVILMLVLGNLNVHLRQETHVSTPQQFLVVLRLHGNRT